MSYKIRYGYDSYRKKPTNSVIQGQCLVSGLLALLLGMAGLWRGDEQRLTAVLCSGPTTIAEQAVSALSVALARGESWYQALAVWCRTIIDGAAV